MVRNIEKNEYFNTKRKKLENKISNVEKRINKINSLENIPLGGNQKARYLSWNEFAKSPEGIKLTVIPYKDEQGQVSHCPADIPEVKAKRGQKN